MKTERYNHWYESREYRQTQLWTFFPLIDARTKNRLGSSIYLELGQSSEISLLRNSSTLCRRSELHGCSQQVAIFGLADKVLTVIVTLLTLVYFDPCNTQPACTAGSWNYWRLKIIYYTACFLVYTAVVTPPMIGTRGCSCLCVYVTSIEYVRDLCCLYYFLRNSLVALLEALFATKMNLLRVIRASNLN